MDTVAQISRYASRFFSGTVFSRVTGMVREICMATAFGFHPSVASFFIAFRLTNLPRRLFGEGVMHAVFVPAYESHRAEGRGKGFTQDFLATLTIWLIVLTLLIEIGLGLISSYLPADWQETAHLAALMAPALLFICLYGLNLAFLNCQGVYFLPSVAPALFNVVWIVGVGLLWNCPVQQAMTYLAGVVVVAYGTQWAFTLPSIWRSLRPFRFSLFSLPVRRVVRPLLLAILGAGATQINYALDPIFARIADPSGPAYLWYALRLQQVPLAFFGIALAGALLPSLSRAVKEGNHRRFDHLLLHAIQKVIELMMPCALAFWVMGMPIIQLIYNHGRVTPEAIGPTVYCLWCYAVGLVPMTLCLVYTAAFHAHKNYRIPAIVSGISVMCNVGLNALFVCGFHWGAYAVALATALASGLQLILLHGLLRRLNSTVPLIHMTLSGGASYLAAKLAAVITLAVAWWLPTAKNVYYEAINLALEAGCFAGMWYGCIRLFRLRRVSEEVSNHRYVDW